MKALPGREFLEVECETGLVIQGTKTPRRAFQMDRDIGVNLPSLPHCGSRGRPLLAVSPSRIPQHGHALGRNLDLDPEDVRAGKKTFLGALFLPFQAIGGRGLNSDARNDTAEPEDGVEALHRCFSKFDSCL